MSGYDDGNTHSGIYIYPQTSEWGFSDFSVSKAESLFTKVLASLCRGGGVHPLIPRTVKSADAAALGIPKDILTL
jgi:hypothetical protein